MVKDGPKKPRPANHIHPAIRVLLTLAGLGSGLIAFFAIMRRHTPEVGGVAFVVLAGVLIALAAIGRIPRRINVGGNSAEFDADATEKLVELLATLPADLKSSVTQAMADAAPSNVNVQRAAKEVGSEALFEQGVVSELAALGFVVALDSPYRNVADAVIFLNDVAYAVEIFTKRVSRASITNRIARVQVANLAGLIVVFPKGSDLQFYRGSFADRPVWFVTADNLASLRTLVGQEFQ